MNTRVGKQFQSLQSGGFTIVEILVIVVVLVILISIVTVSYVAITNDSRAQALTTDLKTVGNNLSKYRADNGSYPTLTIFNTTAIEKSNASGGTTYTYTYNSGAGSYCLQAAYQGQTFHIDSGNSTVSTGAC